MQSIALCRCRFYVDSKQLSEKQRDELFGCIRSYSDLLGWKAEILSPNDISNGMLQRCVQYGCQIWEQVVIGMCNALTQCFMYMWPYHRTKYSLNALSHDTAKKLIRRVLDDGVLLSEVHCNCKPPTNPTSLS